MDYNSNHSDDRGLRKPLNYYCLSRSEMIKFIPDNARTLLDVGCGEGIFGHEVKQRFSAEVWGLELVNHIADVAKKRIDHVVIADH